MNENAQRVVEALLERGWILATAESCTGGLVSEKITEVPGCSAVFTCGVCSYANEIKESVLGVRPETLMRYGAVSPQTAREMATGVRRLAGADIGISTTGIAGPGGGSAEKPVGLVYIAVDSDSFCTVEKLLLDPMQIRTRQEIREDAAERVLALALRAMSGGSESEKNF